MSAKRRTLLWALVAWTLLWLLAGLLAGGEGWSWGLFQGGDSAWIVAEVRVPRTLGTWATGGLLGLAGAVAQGLFRNPLADPFLLGTASGASLGVVLVLAAGGPALAAWAGWAQISLVLGAFAGAVLGMLLTLSLARGAQHTGRLLLSGVVVGVMLTAVSDLITHLQPEALRARQLFMLGSTGFFDRASVAWLMFALALSLAACMALARTLDALVLGEDTAKSLGLPLERLRMALVLLMALATGVAVSQAGLVAFVGLVAPHLVKRFAPGTQRYTLAASAAAGGGLLLAADVLARSLVAPQELPVGVLTAVLGGGYLLCLLRAQVRP